MNYYPYINPIILTDPIFFAYGGQRGSSSPEQRQAAYWIAEVAASDDLSTFLLPTTVTGTYIFNPAHAFILEHGYINSIIETRFMDENEKVYYTEKGINNGHVKLLDDEYGFLSTVMCYGCDIYPYKVQFVYNAGLPSGTSFRPDILLGLTTYADIVLNEIQGYGNEAPGDIGVQNYKNQQYTESRVALIRTVFGTSARAQFIHRLFTKFRHHRWVGL
jgi:hypothetical protein